MKLKKIFAVVSALCMMCAVMPTTENSVSDNTAFFANAEDYEIDLSQEAVYQAMIALKKQYPEGTKWTNANSYAWHGGIFDVGFGCAGFAFMLSDAAFGNLKAREYYDVDSIRIGDILRINNDSHSVIVLDITDDIITVAEGNYNSSVHWGRTFTKSNLNNIMDYALTRYPEDYVPQDTTDEVETKNDVAYMEENKITLDFNKDGEVNAKDASWILVYAAEKGAGNVKSLEEFCQKNGIK